MKALRPLTASLMLLTSCLLISNTTLAKTTLKLSHNQDKSHAVHKALSYLDKTKEYSNGELVIRIYPNATLGNERESLELMNSGALQMVKVNAASLESFARITAFSVCRSYSATVITIIVFCKVI